MTTRTRRPVPGITQSSGALLAAASMLLLAGCTTAAPATPAVAPTEVAPPADPSTACLVGDWSLDMADYEFQSVSYVASLDAPLEDFTIKGTQTLSVRSDGQFLLQTDVVTGVSLAVDGYVRMYSTRSTGFSTAEWLQGVDPGTIALTEWVDTLEITGDAPEESGLGGGVGFGAVPIVSAVCDGDRLALSGPDLPLVSNWTRQD
jgi:hypothetical protein